MKVNSDGSWSRVANLSAFQKLHPTQNPEPDDFEPDGTWYNLIAADGVLYAVEPNHGEVDAITTSGVGHALDRHFRDPGARGSHLHCAHRQRIPG